MEWTNIEEELPKSDTICWVYIQNIKSIALRIYKYDSFGLGGLDYEVSFWQEFKTPVVPKFPDLDQTVQSNQLTLDHISACF